MPGTYLSGIDIPIYITAGGVEASVQLYARDFEGATSVGLSFLMTFISGDNPNASLTVPHSVGDGLLRTVNGIITLDQISVYPTGFVRVHVFAGSRMVAEGGCRYDTRVAERSRHVRRLKFEGQRNAITVRSDQSSTSGSNTSTAGQIGSSVTGSVAPGGVGVSGTVNSSVTTTNGRSASQTRGGAEFTSRAGSVFQIHQVVPE